MSSKQNSIEVVYPGKFAKDGRFGGVGAAVLGPDDRILGKVTALRAEDDGLHIEIALTNREDDGVKRLLAAPKGLDYGFSGGGTYYRVLDKRRDEEGATDRPEHDGFSGE